jgi:MYXO-CTERM domain-containing protein
MRILRMSAAAAFLFLAPAAQASPVVPGDTLTLVLGNGAWSTFELIASVNGGAPSFITFSLQLTEGTSYGQPLPVAGVEKYAVTEGPSTGGDGTGRDPISSQTAWLYTNFRTGGLTGYDGSLVAINRLQEAFWWFENEPIANQSTNPFVLAANSAVQSGFTGTGNVFAANLLLPTGGGLRDVLLYQVPGPSTLIVALSGLVAAVGLRRRRA